jgi:hypothetical protein
MKNIQLIPTKDKGRITKHNKELHIEKIGIYNEPSIKMEVFNMYITSDEEIKEGDWYCSPYGIISKHNGTEILPDYWRKIILTTDEDLIKDGVQAIDDDFLEWFVNNPSCDEVEVYEVNGKLFAEPIIIPKEEPTILEEAKQRAANYMSLKGALNSQYVDFSNPNADKISSTSTTSFKQETREEAAKRIYGSDASKDVEYYAFLNGAKWQQKRMYSEEDMREAFIAGGNSLIEEDDDYGTEYDAYMEQWFKQFKKK